MVCLLLGGAAATAAAQDPAPSPSPTPVPVTVSGFVDVYYASAFNETPPLLRTFDVQHDAFSLSLAEIAFAKAVSPESRVGFRADLDFGKTADLAAAYEPESDGKEIGKHVQQAYVSALVGPKLQVDFGKYVTPLGAEVIESQDNWNYTRSVLFGYAIPFYHVGVRASLPLNDRVSLSGYLVNGWNNSSEIDGGKTFGVGATAKPSDKVTWVATVMAGREVPGGETRTLVDSTLTLAAGPRLSLMANADYGKEGDTKWWGVAGYAKFQAAPHWALVGRYEYLDDTEGGFMTLGMKGQSLTITSDHLLAGALRARLEYRTDFADAPFFADSDGALHKSQTTATVGLVYSFSGGL